MDCFYKILNHKQHDAAQRNEYNFDHPDAFDFELMLDVLKKLKEGRKVEVPVYNFVTHARESVTKTMYGANVIIFEGILTFHSAEVLDVLDMKIFVDTDADIRLARRLKRWDETREYLEVFINLKILETFLNAAATWRACWSNTRPWSSHLIPITLRRRWRTRISSFLEAATTKLQFSWLSNTWTRSCSCAASKSGRPWLTRRWETNRCQTRFISCQKHLR